MRKVATIIIFLFVIAAILVIFSSRADAYLKFDLTHDGPDVIYQNDQESDQFVLKMGQKKKGCYCKQPFS